METSRTPETPGAQPPAREPSGILVVKTRFLRRLRAPGRKLPRPADRTLVVLFALVLAGGLGAFVHRKILDGRFARNVEQSRAAPYEVKRLRADLLRMQVDEKTLAGALDARVKRLESARRNQFFISIDVAKGRFEFHYADQVLRDAPVQVGAARTITAAKRSWTFAPLSGSFSVRDKHENGGWVAPEWVYRMNGKAPPKPLKSIRGGLGRYVIVLGNDYVIHSPPPPESPLKGPKPGSFMVPEADLAAIWPRIGPETRVYITGAEGDALKSRPEAAGGESS